MPPSQHSQQGDEHFVRSAQIPHPAAAGIHITKAIALSLVTIHVHFPYYRKFLFLPTRVIFPSLMELALYGPDQDPNEDLRSASEADAVTSANRSGRALQFPLLQRLHLADVYFNPAECFRRIAGDAPSLTHLCLPSISFTADDPLAGLGTRTRSGSHDTTLPSDSYHFAVRTLPSTIEMVLVHLLFRLVGVQRVGRITIWDYNASKKPKNRMRGFICSQNCGMGLRTARYWLDRIEGGEDFGAVSQS